jgi:four helix bundle protein
MNIHSVAMAMSTLVALRATRVAIEVGSKGSKGSKGSRVTRDVRTFGMASTLLISRLMTANDFTELVAWQRADELERFALEIIKRPKLARDRDYCTQTSDAASSAPRNIAEGFGRFGPIQNANFVRIAIGSEMETKNQITKAWQRGAISMEEYNSGMLLCRRALGAAIGYRRYLLSEAAKANAKKIESNQVNRDRALKSDASS